MIRFFSWFLIPCLTVLIPGRNDWFTSNFSVAASESPAWYLLIFWALATGGFFHFLIKRTIGQPVLAPLAGKEQILTDWAAVLLLVSVLIPYRPDRCRLFSAIHVACAFLASVLLYLILLLLDLKLYFRYRQALSRLTAVLLFAGLFCVSLFLWADSLISSALEIFFTVFSCLWLTAFQRKVSALCASAPDSLPSALK